MRRVQIGGATGEVTLFGEAGGHPGSAQVGLDGGVVVAGPLEKMGANGLETVAVRVPFVAVEGAECGEARGGAVDHGEGDGPAERGGGTWRDLGEHVVEGEDLRPVGAGVGGRLVVQCGDGRLDLV